MKKGKIETEHPSATGDIPEDILLDTLPDIPEQVAGVPGELSPLASTLLEDMPPQEAAIRVLLNSSVIANQTDGGYEIESAFALVFLKDLSDDNAQELKHKTQDKAPTVMISERLARQIAQLYLRAKAGG